MSRELFGNRRVLVQVIRGMGVLVLLVVLMMWLSRTFVDKVKPGPPERRAEPAPSLATRPVRLQTFPLIMEQMGTVRSERQAKVSSRIMAQVQNILVQEGESVQGQVNNGARATLLAKLDDRTVRTQVEKARTELAASERALKAAEAGLQATRAQLTAAEANFENARSDYERYLDLYRNQAATGQQLEDMQTQKEMAESQRNAARQQVLASQSNIRRIRAQIQQARAALEEATVMLSYTEIRAPFSGRLISKLVDVGDMVSPGQPLFVLETSAAYELHAVVSESLLPYLRGGQELTVAIDALGIELHGTVRKIVPQADPASRTVLVKVALPAYADLVSGLFGRLRIPHGEYSALVVPVEAIRRIGQLHLVEVMGPQGYPSRRFITLGHHHNGMVEILSGLQEGEEVVLP
jgi:multidrug resistance efflux pump